MTVPVTDCLRFSGQQKNYLVIMVAYACRAVNPVLTNSRQIRA
ncbi:hypothetical protein [Sporomusa aerivorans]